MILESIITIIPLSHIDNYNRILGCTILQLPIIPFYIMEYGIEL